MKDVTVKPSDEAARRHFLTRPLLPLENPDATAQQAIADAGMKNFGPPSSEPRQKSLMCLPAFFIWL